MGELESRIGGSKTWKNVGNKGKNLKGTVSARGLVFGPIRGEAGVLSSGKT